MEENVYDYIGSESLNGIGNKGKTSKERVDWYLSDAITIIENDNSVNVTDVKLLINAARKELENIKEK